MKNKFDFFKTTMPITRKADYYLGCLDGSVFIDFDRSNTNRISLARISFDGYGCCDLDSRSKRLNVKDSQKFIEEIEKDHLDQVIIGRLVNQLIRINQAHIWNDAIDQYGFVEKK